MKAREAALKIILEVELQGAYASLALKKWLKKYDFSTKDRHLITHLAYGTIKHKNTLDWALDAHLKQRERLDPVTLNILRLGAYQLIYLTRIPSFAAVNEAVELAKKYVSPRRAPLVNAVLRNLKRSLPLKFPDPAQEEVSYLVLKYSYPAWLVEKLLTLKGFEETEKFLIFNNVPPPLTLRTNILKNSRAELIERLQQEGTEAFPLPNIPVGLFLKEGLPVDELPSYKKGYFSIQEEASMLAAYAVSPSKGSIVLDACAAPGGKTTHLAEVMADEGMVIATDLYAHRLQLVKSNAKRLGLKSIRTLDIDARQAKEKIDFKFDYILVDAPCSELGVLRHFPDIRWRRQPKDLLDLPQLQLQILEGVLPLLKVGGVLVYTTCSILPEENEGIAEIIEQRHPGLQPENLASYLPPAFKKEAAKINFWPPEDGIEGFFISRWRNLF